MTKSTVTKLFIGGGFAIISGAILAIAGVWIAIASDVFVMKGSDIAAIRGSALAWSVLGVALVGMLAIAAGTIAGLASWIGALIVTSKLDRKAWFVGLFVLGILSFGFFGMMAYIVAGPDSRSGPAKRPSPLSATAA